MNNKNNSLKYLQFIGIVLNKDNSDKKHKIIKNLKNLLFLRGFCLVVKEESFLSKEDLLVIVNNLSELNLIENVRIEAINIDLDETEEKNVSSCIEGIQIKKQGNKILIELNSEIFYDIFNRKLKELCYS